ncbi:hypothetical protein TCAL_14806 [Tigriopus californicus]|uniref:Uncharacterized protein n=1 Tax=Tigriopus californicus TaxID=6832 RepID=A0A553PR35_TIGCA|nr:hypothetical protein TCAL_14806 [Tigriopus californicus]
MTRFLTFVLIILQGCLIENAMAQGAGRPEDTMSSSEANMSSSEPVMSSTEDTMSSTQEAMSSSEPVMSSPAVTSKAPNLSCGQTVLTSGQACCRDSVTYDPTRRVCCGNRYVVPIAFSAKQDCCQDKIGSQVVYYARLHNANTEI